MTKVATIDTRRFFALLLIAAMLMAMIPIGVAMLPSGVLAAEDNVTGTFGVNDGSFDIVGVEVWSTILESSLTPTIEYHVNVEVLYENGLDRLDEVKVILFYESDGEIVTDNAMGSDDSQMQATFQWTPGLGFVIVDDTTTWDCDDAHSVPPVSLAVPQDVFEFHITVGEVATQTIGPAAKWFAYASATDTEESATRYDFSGALDMEWWGSIEATGAPDWDAAAPGAPYTLQSVSVKYVANGAFDKGAKASGSWSRTGNGTPAILTDADTLEANEFALKANESTSEPVGESQRLNSGDYIVIGTGPQTEEVGDTDTSGLWLKLGTPFYQGTYTGTIFFEISNS
jgi:hypothetical protein